MRTGNKKKSITNCIGALVVVFFVIVLTLFSGCPQAGLLPELIGKAKEDAFITIESIPGVTPPASGETPVTTITETNHYTGTVSWEPDDDYFAAETVYTATITLKAKSGYTLTGIAENFFTITEASAVSNNADSGVVTAVFPTTGGPRVIYYANGGTAGSAPTDPTEYDNGDEVTVLDNIGNLAGAEVGGDHTGSGIKQRLIGWNTDSGATTTEYVVGNTFIITENTILYAIYTTGDDVFRKVGPAGGWVFYDHGSNPGWGRYLEAWNEDESISYQWKTSTTVTVGTLTNIGTGEDNTNDHMTGPEHPVADAVRGRTYGGSNDWFLPSKDALYEMCWILHSRRWNVSEGKSEDNPTYGTNRVGGFADERYWSSSEYNGEEAWSWSFYNGGNYLTSKTTNFPARAVRAF